MATTNSKRILPGSEPDGEDRDTRRTVIPTPRSGGMFPGWGVRF
jgi:hypothetical protein